MCVIIELFIEIDKLFTSTSNIIVLILNHLKMQYINYKFCLVTDYGLFVGPGKYSLKFELQFLWCSVAVN
jgi:hypothetical protein